MLCQKSLLSVVLISCVLAYYPLGIQSEIKTKDYIFCLPYAKCQNGTLTRTPSCRAQ